MERQNGSPFYIIILQPDTTYGTGCRSVIKLKGISFQGARSFSVADLGLRLIGGRYVKKIMDIHISDKYKYNYATKNGIFLKTLGGS